MVQKIKTGMEVGLTSPNSEQIVATGTVQEICDEEYVKILVTIVYKKTTVLPKPKGRMTHVGDTEAHCITWPRKKCKYHIVPLNQSAKQNSDIQLFTCR